MKINIMCVAIVLIGILSFCCQTKPITDPKLVGMVAFAKLKKFDNSTQDNFEEGFVSFEEAVQLKKNDSIKRNDQRKDVPMQLEKWNKTMLDNFNSIKESGQRFGIIWSDIEYDNYISHKSLFYDFTRSGILYFKHKSKPYIISVTDCYDGHEYKIHSIYSLQEDKWGYAK